jgi:hypothetical protein
MGSMADAFGWSADQFWRSTSHEVWAAIEARQRSNARINGG